MSLLQKMLSAILTLCIVLQSIPTAGNAEGLVTYQEHKVEEQFIAETLIDEETITQKFILEHMIYEDELYEVRIDEDLIVQAYTIQLTVDVNTQTSMAGVLLPQLDDYDIDWPAVIAKFAIGTAIIVVVGVVYYVTKGTSSFFIMATPGKVLKSAIIGGAIDAALHVSINEVAQDGISSKAAVKYAIEGFADGYMWGAIGSVLHVTSKNIRRLKAFHLANGEKFQIKIDGSVVNESKNIIGKAYYGKNQWYLLDAAGNETRVFDKAGKEIIDLAKVELPSPNLLPANTTLSIGAQRALKVCYTDASGVIYRIGDDLVPNLTYKIGDAVYKTDSSGRLIEAAFDKLQLKGDRGRFPILDSMEVIGKGDALTNDERGHLIADLFNGNNTIANIVPMSGTVNKGAVKNIETKWAQALKNGKNVKGSILISYDGSSFRPSSFTYKYNIGDEMTEALIKNY